MEKTRVALADDQSLFRKGLASLLKSFNTIEVMYEANNGQELIDLLTSQVEKPHIIMMDLNMPVMNGIDATAYIKKHFPQIRIIVLSVHNQEKFVIHMLELDVNGYLFKDCEPEEVARAIGSVMENDFYMNEQVIKALRKNLSGKKEKVSLDTPFVLTSREQEILDMICKEFTTSEIADKLSISIRTVEGHRNNLLQKAGARNVAGLVVYAMKHNLTDVGF